MITLNRLRSPLLVEMGRGKVFVDIGYFGGRASITLSPVEFPGPATRVVMTFPTWDHADLVRDALLNRAAELNQSKSGETT